MNKALWDLRQASIYCTYLFCLNCGLLKQPANNCVKNFPIIFLYIFQIEDWIRNSQYLARGWEEIKQMKAELWIYFHDADQQLHNMKRRGAELELNVAQNMVLQVKVRKKCLNEYAEHFI